MIFKHTPGPWQKDGNTVYALMHNGWKRGVELFRNRFYATVYVDRECSEEEKEANARLISAAPELLEALLNFTEGCSVSVDAFAVARAAIGKATGTAVSAIQAKE